MELYKEDYPVDEYSNFYPPCLGGARCEECKPQCKDVQGLKWSKGGKECYQSCKDRLGRSTVGTILRTFMGGGSQPAPLAIASTPAYAPAPAYVPVSNQPQVNASGGLGTGAIIGISVAAVAVLSGISYLIFRK